MERVCESCGGQDEELVAVEPRGDASADIELWCSVCRAERDHELSEPS